jgi:hypothetical protein
MTNKHFCALADVIRRERAIAMAELQTATVDPELNPAFENGVLSGIGAMTQVLADFCAAQNPKFNRERWLGYIAGTNGKNGGAAKKSSYAGTPTLLDSVRESAKLLR